MRHSGPRHGSMLLAASLGLAGAVAGAEEPGRLLIEHEPVACVLADAFPSVVARFSGEDLGRARVRFRGEGEAWYSVSMFPTPDGGYSAVLPRPKASLKTLRYAVEATDRDAGQVSTPEYAASVVTRADACTAGALAAIAVSPPLIDVEVPDGTRSGPPGFSGKNVLGVYASGKPVKGRPRTALIGVAGAGAAAAGIALLKNEPVGSSAPPPPDPSMAYVRFESSSPPPGSTVSLDRGSLSMRFTINMYTTFRQGTPYSVELFADATGPTRPCVVLAGALPVELTLYTPTTVTASTPFAAVDAGCGSSFTVSGARVKLERTGFGFSTGETYPFFGTIPDVPVSFRFVP